MVRKLKQPLTTLINDIAGNAGSELSLEKRRWAKAEHPALSTVDCPHGKKKLATASIWGAETEPEDKYTAAFSPKPMNFSGEQVLASMFHRVGLVSRRGLKPHCNDPNQDDFFYLVRGDRLLFGVCDGHGDDGHIVSHFVQKNLPRLLLEQLHAAEKVEADDERSDRGNCKALEAAWTECARSAFKKLDHLIIDKLQEPAQHSGCTATAVLVCPEMVFTAHVGDSLAILIGPNSEMRELTSAHRPDRPDEMERIKGFHGEVEFPVDYNSAPLPARLKAGSYSIAMSRSIGDLVARPYGIISEPEVSQGVPLEDRHSSILVCSDGVWDMIPPVQVVPLVSRSTAEVAQETLERLALKAQRRWQEKVESVDDITGVFVHPCFWEPPDELREHLDIHDHHRESDACEEEAEDDKEALLEAFNKFDINGDGTISKEEVFEMLQVLDPTFTKEDVDKVLYAADSNKDGKVDFKEFVSWIFAS